MMSLPNGVSSGADGEEGGGDPAGHTLPNTAWGGTGDVGMPEGRYIRQLMGVSATVHSSHLVECVQFLNCHFWNSIPYNSVCLIFVFLTGNVDYNALYCVYM